MRIIIAAILLLTSGLYGQTLGELQSNLAPQVCNCPQSLQLNQTIPIDFQVHYLGSDTIKAKYGRKLPKSIFAGSVTGVNKSNVSITIGQGYVLQVLRSKGFLALSQQDARAIVLKAQGTGIRGQWNKYSPIAVKILDDINNLQIFKVISLPVPVAAGLATADAIAKATQTDVSQILSDIYQNYEADGIQNIMQLAPGGSLSGTLLFEAEGARPNTQNIEIFTVQVPHE